MGTELMDYKEGDFVTLIEFPSGARRLFLDVDKSNLNPREVNGVFYRGRVIPTEKILPSQIGRVTCLIRDENPFSFSVYTGSQDSLETQWDFGVAV